MNQDPPAPFDTVGDEHVEARIVAWVLGEASAFEAAELERLCEERPELLVFRRRIEAVHGLLGEAAASGSDAAWILTPAKRQSIEEKFGVEMAAQPESWKEKRIRHSGRRALFAIAACLILTIVVAGLMAPKERLKGGIDINGGTAFELQTADAKPENLAKAIRDQEDKVEERRKALTAIVRSRGIIYRGNDSFYQSGVDEDKGAGDALESYNDLLQQKLQTESQITGLLKYDGDQLMTYAAGLDLPDNVTKNARPQYLEAKRQLESAKMKGLDDDHPSVKAAAEQVQAAKRQMDEGVVNLRSTLQARMELATDRLKNMERMKDDTREEAIKRGLEAQDYVEAKRSFEADEQLLQTMKLRQAELAGGFENGNLDGPAAPATADKPATPEVALRARVVPAPQSSTHPSKEMAENESQRSAGLKADGPAPAAAPDAWPELAKSLPRQATQPSKDEKTWGSRFGLSDEAQATPARAESIYPTDSEPPATETASASKPQALAAGQSIPSQPERQENGALGWGGRGHASSNSELSGKIIKQLQLPPPQEAAGLEYADGLRSRDSAVNRNSIDAILNNPNRPAAMPAEAEGKKSLAGKDFAKAKSSATDAAPPPTLAAKAAPAAASPRSDASADEPQLAHSEMESRARATDYAQRETAKLKESQLEKRDMGDHAKAADDADRALTDPQNADAKREMSYLEDSVRTNPGLTYEHTQNVDKVRRGLYMGEGNLNLGKYDEAKREYEDVLRTDPNNAPARRGLERVAGAKSDYYRAAYDHTRAELLSQVDKAWELSVPEDIDGDEKSKLKEAARRFASHMPTYADSTNAMGSERYFYSQSDSVTGAVPANENLGEPFRMDLAVQGGDPNPPGAFTEPLGRASELESMQPGDAQASLTSEAQKAVVNPADLMEETAAAENPYSTFSLNISDASFQLAKAALAKGERPDPAAIKVEQFYNAVDYGDPGPAANEPVAATVEQSAHPVIPGRNLVRVALRTASAGRSAAQPLRLTLLVDQSGSMVREDRRAAMEQAVKQLGGLLTANDKITVIGFSRTSRLLADGLTGDQGASLGGLINQTASEGGTNLEEAMKLGAQMAARHQTAGAQNRIVLFTDGAANLGNPDHEKLTHEVEALRQKGIAFDVAGIGGVGLNDRLLGELARHGNGRYYVVDDAKDQSFARQLAGAFRPAAENVKVQVNFNPQRVGRYKLIGFEKDRLQTEDFRNDAVDAAELAADEAGVAIYQVEPLAGGGGEIGEVSVRFKDAASGEMVERAWTIPYETAPAFDRATPSMQLAGLSMLAAEKLKGGPLADATDLKQLAGPEALVKQFYGSSPRVGEMLRVIDALK